MGPQQTPDTSHGRRTFIKAAAATGVAFTALASGSSLVRAATTTVQNGESIQAAVNAAAAGDTISVEAGTYAENVTVDKALTIVGPNDGVHPEYGSRGPEAVVEGRFVVSADGVTISGFRITNSDFGVRAPSGTVALSDITVTYTDFDSLANSAVRFGLGFGGGIGSADWTVSENRILNPTGDEVTTIILFNVDGVTLANNYIRHTVATKGRRGHNLDGCRSVEMRSCDVDMGGRDVLDDIGGTFVAALYSLQLSMSDRSVSDVHVCNNVFRGSYDGMVTLGNGDISDLVIEDNEIYGNVLGIRFQAGTNTPAGSVDDVELFRNDITGMFAGVIFQNGGDPYSNVSMNLNDLSGNGNSAVWFLAGPTVNDTIDAERNWWGSRDGPQPGDIRDDTNPSQISTKPWLRNANAAGAVPGDLCEDDEDDEEEEEEDDE